MTEKILAKHADRARVAPGENIWTRVDKLLTHDVCGPGTFGIFQKEFGEDAQVGSAAQTRVGSDEVTSLSKPVRPRCMSFTLLGSEVAPMQSSTGREPGIVLHPQSKLASLDCPCFANCKWQLLWQP